MTATAEERLSRLEKSNRKLKVGILALTTIVAATIILGAAAPPPKIVTAEKFVLLDPDGHERAEFSANNKSAALQFLNSNGTRGIMIASGGEGNGISLSDENGHQRTFLMVESGGEAAFATVREGLPQETFILSDGVGGTSMAIRDLAGKDRVNLGTTPKGAGLSVADGNATPRAIITDTTMAAFDKGGQMYWGSFPDDITPEGRKRIMDAINSAQQQQK
jgi:hypothetical protein